MMGGRAKNGLSDSWKKKVDGKWWKEMREGIIGGGREGWKKYREGWIVVVVCCIFWPVLHTSNAGQIKDFVCLIYS